MLYLILSLITIARSQERNLIDQRDEEFSRIKHYELIYFNDTEIIEIDNKFVFDAFGQHYEIELTRNDDYHVANIRHPSINNKLHEHFTGKQLKESCHYFGRVVNTEEPSETRVTLSFCDNAGIRGRIDAFNDVITINPSAYFLDKEKDSKYQHKLDDEHLIYKLSDFDMSDMNHNDMIDIEKIKITNNNLYDNKDKENHLKDTNKNDNIQRRRLFTTNTLELLVVIDPERYQYYQSTYGSAWYTNLYNDCVRIITPVATEYGNTQWGFGSITVKFVEIEVVTSYTGNYASLKPEYVTSTTINAHDWGGIFGAWLQQYKDMSTFDNAHIFTNARFASGASGYGAVGQVCQGMWSSGIDFMGYGITPGIRTLAHEMGHNFGMVHDAYDNSCGFNDGIMGYGSGQRFSSCSIQEANAYYNQQNTLTCLRTGWSANEWRSNYGSNTAPQPSPRPTTKPPTPSSVSTWSCMNVQNLDLPQYNGYWTYKGTHGNRPYYQKGTMYIYLDVGRQWYFMGPTVGSSSAYGYCPYSYIQSCIGQFVLYNNGWVQETDSRFSQASTASCSSSTSSCSSYSCVGFYQMPTTPYGNFNGQWRPVSGQCHNGQAVYALSSQSGKYLHYSSQYNKWIIGNSLGGSTAYTYSPAASTNVIGTSRNWYYYNSGWLGASSTYVYDCGGNTGFLGDECLDDKEYGDKLCISRGDDDYSQYGNETDSYYKLWNGNKTFEIDNCVDGKPVYQYSAFMSVETDEEDPVIGNALEQGISLVYYLHHHEQERYSDSNETYSQWIISKDTISLNAVAICEEDNLLDCTKSSWLVQDLESDSFRKVIDEFMELTNGHCGYVESEDIEDGADESNDLLMIILVVAFVVIVCGIAVCVFIYRYKKENKLIANVANIQRNVGDEDELEQELSPKNKNGETIQEEQQEIIVETAIPVNTTHTYE